MLTFTAKLTKTRLALAALTVVAIPVIILAVRGAGDSVPAVTPPTNVAASTEEERIAFLGSFGWQIEAGTESRREITVPAVFDKVYEPYNQLQQSQGFDLTPYKNQPVEAYNYKITNYPGGNDSVYATLLVSDGKVIGGDIHSVALDGFMHGFNLSGTGMEIGQYSPPEETDDTTAPATTATASTTAVYEHSGLQNI